MVNIEVEDYFARVKEVLQKDIHEKQKQELLDEVYLLVEKEILSNDGKPVNKVKFGTSGWRGTLGKDLFCKSVAQVTLAIVDMYKSLSQSDDLAKHLGVESLEEAKTRGCVLGFDNRFGGEILASSVADVLISQGFTVFYAGESTTGVLSAAVLELNAAFSINLTPSHNPMEYGGFKYNAADAGPAQSELTNYITSRAREIIDKGIIPPHMESIYTAPKQISEGVKHIDSFGFWEQLVMKNLDIHGVDLKGIREAFGQNGDVVAVIDSVHGASRLHISRFFGSEPSSRIIHLRDNEDVTFGGVAPEPSSKNMQAVVKTLQKRKEPLKLGAIIDPDGDRIRFTDGDVEISMNQFGAMAYHFLHQSKQKRGSVAKTVASSNLANSIAKKLSEEVFEPKVGFKEFKPVIGEALVCFEESDGISIIGHTPEKDAYIGLLLALDIMLTTGKKLSVYLSEIEKEFGAYYPDRDGVEVSLKGKELMKKLSNLEKYKKGAEIKLETGSKKITEVIAIDGRKMILEDGSWLMVRPSGTEPKVRFYVESRSPDGTEELVRSAKRMLQEIGLLQG